MSRGRARSIEEFWVGERATARHAFGDEDVRRFAELSGDFNELHVDAYFLEYDDERAGDFRPLRFVPKHKTVVLGLVTSKVGDLESRQTLIDRVKEAARFMPLDNASLSPQCGFSSTVEGNELTEEQQWAKLRLIVDVAREIWGD